MNTTKDYIEYNGIKVKFVAVNNDLAKDYIQSSKGNRRIAENRVSHYKNQMDNGNWSPISTIIVDNEGSLKDGHHRMYAQAMSEIENVFIEISGVPMKYLSSIDTGRPRSAADFCCFIDGLKDITDIKRCCSMSRFLIQVANKLHHNFIVDYSSIADFIDEEKVNLLKAIDICKEIKHRSGFKANTGFACAVFKIIKRGDSHSSGFFESIITGANLDIGNPVLALRNYLTSTKFSASNQETMNNYCIVAEAWNGYVNGREIRQFKSLGSWRRTSKDVFETKFV